MPVARHTACEIAWHKREQRVVAVCRVMPVAAAIVPVFPAGTYRHYRGVHHCNPTRRVASETTLASAKGSSHLRLENKPLRRRQRHPKLIGGLQGGVDKSWHQVSPRLPEGTANHETDLVLQMPIQREITNNKKATYKPSVGTCSAVYV